MRSMLRAAAIAGLVGMSGGEAVSADFDGPFGGPDVIAVPASAGVACLFEEGAPVISLPWRSIWLGHFSGGASQQTTYGQPLIWKNENVCFPSHASCNRWIHANRRAFHNPEGHWTCLPIR